MPNASTQRYAVFGHPVAHSLSPAMHNAAFDALGWSARYEAHDVTPEALAQELRNFRENGGNGVNLTIPLKSKGYELVDEHDITALQLGVVNTVAFDGNRMKGYNTDGIGILQAIQESFGGGPAKKQVAIYGCGGAGRAVAIACACAGCKSIILVNRTRERAEAVAVDVQKSAPTVAVKVMLDGEQETFDRLRDADLIVQCSSVGLHHGDNTALPAQAFRQGQWVYDLIYAPPFTPTLMVARQQGALIDNGLGMLLHQGVASFKIWTGVQPDVTEMRKALTAALAARASGT